MIDGTPAGADPVRVLWLIKGLGPGGAEHLLVSLAAAHDRAVVAPSAAYVLPWKDALVPRLEAAGVPVTLLGGRRGVADLRWLPRLRALVARGDVDVVHTHSPLVAAAARLAVRTVPRRRRPAVVTTEHNAWGRFALPTRLANAATTPLTDAIVAVSDEVRDSIGARHRDGTEVVVHGVDVAAVRAAAPLRDEARAELGVGPDQVLVLTVANLSHQKAYPDLLQAARTVLDGDGGDRIRFAAVGQGPLAEAVAAEHARLDLGDRFRLLGRRDDVFRLLAGADVFALASHFEGYPVALMEALAAGLPVVATAVGGVADALTDGVHGRLVPPGRPDALAAAITEVAGDAEGRARWAAAARRRGDDFGIAAAARRLEAIYRSVAPAR